MEVVDVVDVVQGADDRFKPFIVRVVEIDAAVAASNAVMEALCFCEILISFIFYFLPNLSLLSLFRPKQLS